MSKMTAPPPCYALLYPALVEVARRHGYALAIHGSMARDFDLVAVPWTEEAGEPLPMIDEMKAAVQGVYTHHDFDHLLKDGHKLSKPHGRLAWSVHLTAKGADGPYLDISVMPRSGPAASAQWSDAQLADIDDTRSVFRDYLDVQSALNYMDALAAVRRKTPPKGRP